MNDHFFRIRENRFELALTAPPGWSDNATKKLATFLAETGDTSNLFDLEMPILSTVGFNSMNFFAMLQWEKLAVDTRAADGFISSACFDAAVRGARRGALEFYKVLKARKKNVYAVPAPTRYPSPAAIPVYENFNRVMQEELSKIGVKIVDVGAQTTDARGELLPKFADENKDDRQHGNAAYGALVIEKFLAMIGDSAATQSRNPTYATAAG